MPNVQDMGSPAMDEVLSAVVSSVRSILSDGTITIEPRTDMFLDLGFDSLKFITVVTVLSEQLQFDVDQLDSEAFGRIRSVGDLVAIVRALPTA